MSPSHSKVYNNQFLGFEQRTKKKVLTFRGMPQSNKSPPHQYPPSSNPYQDAGSVCFTVRNKDSIIVKDTSILPEERSIENIHVPAYVKFR